MKLLIFAHTPPPFHGQSYMVKLLLDGLQHPTHGAKPNLRVYHLDARLSPNLEAIGKFRWSKVFLILKYCAQAYWHRFVHGANALYYVPAPGLRAAVYRDWIVMFFCRPLFKKTIFHWHAAGLAEWIETAARNWEKKITHWLLDDADLSIVLSEFGRSNAAPFSPRKVEVVPNGIPDPCPNFGTVILPARQQRLQERRTGSRTTFVVLFIGACTAAKGLFAVLDAVALLNEKLKSMQSTVGIQLVVAGEFAEDDERNRFQDRISRIDLNGGDQAERLVIYKAFVSGDTKNSLFRESDCLVFPSQYAAEGQPVTIIEALAFGLPVVATRWRGIPEMLNGSGSPLISDQDPRSIADAISSLVTEDHMLSCRQKFVERYRVERYIDGLTKALIAASD